MAGTDEPEFLALDVDTINYIFSFLESRDLLQAALICKSTSVLACVKLKEDREKLLADVARLTDIAPQQNMGGTKFVKIPLGLPTLLRNSVKKEFKKKFGVGRVTFVNPEEPMSEIATIEGREIAIANAGLIVAEFLRRNVAFECPKIWPVKFPEDEDWRKKAGANLPSEKRQEEALVRFTEGVTPPRKKGDFVIYINQRYFTTGAIVHEMFHSMQHDNSTSVFKVGQYGNEAMTELYTLLACGLDLRVSRSGGPFYAEARILLGAITGKDPVLTFEDLNRAYFLGDEKILERIRGHITKNLELLRRLEGADGRLGPNIGRFLQQQDYGDGSSG
jgi:hypothetical protein